MTLGFGLQACRQPVPDCHTETPPRPDCDFRFPARRRTVPDCHNQASAHSGCVLRSPARRRADPNRYRMTWRPDPCRRSPALCRTGRSRHTRTPSRSDQRRLNFRTLQTWRARLILQTAQDRRTLQIWRGRPILRTWQGRRTLQTAWDRRRSCGSAPGRLAPAVLRSGPDPRPLFFCRFPAACVHFCHKPGPLPYGSVLRLPDRYTLRKPVCPARIRSLSGLGRFPGCPHIPPYPAPILYCHIPGQGPWPTCRPGFRFPDRRPSGLQKPALLPGTVLPGELFLPPVLVYSLFPWISVLEKSRVGMMQTQVFPRFSVISSFSVL